MAKYEKYAEYKDSGFNWVDKLPAHWTSVHLKWISTIYAGGTPSKTIESYWENGTIPWINSGAVNQTYILEPSTYITKTAYENSSAKWIPKKALVMALAGQGKTKGMVAQLGIDTTCNQSMGAIIPNDLSYARYLFWWITSNYQNIRNMAGGDLRDGLNLEHLGDMSCPLPNEDETQKIANFLDHETAQIDTLIAKQEQLIELLKEKRQAVISHAVTKGLNPDVNMKDSGVEWLGQVPEHWTVSKLKYFASIQGGFAFSSDLFIEEGTQVLRIGNVYQNSLSLERQPIFIANDLVKNFQDFIVKKNDVLMSLTGTLGKRDYGFAIKVETDDQYLLNQRVAKISPNKNIDTDFMVYVLWSESYLTQLYSLPSGTKQANLSNSDVLGIEIVVPQNMQEQKEIARYIKKKLEKFDEMIAKAESAIQFMQERRTALISSAVTGKIDVRNWQNPNHNNNEANTELGA